MQSSPHTEFDLRARAFRAMQEEGFVPTLPAQAASELHAIEAAPERPLHGSGIRDLRGLLWSSIDNRESRDLDQVEVAERLPNGNILLRVGIADVDAYVPRGTALDRHAFDNTSTIYAGVAIFSMLPEPLSTGLTSLLQDQDRLAVVVEMEISGSGEVVAESVYRALLRNHAQLTYEDVGEWLDQKPPRSRVPGGLVGLDQQILLQHEAAVHLQTLRTLRGALDFDTVEARPVIEHGRVVGLDIPQKNDAKRLIENLMIAANTTIASLLLKAGIPSLQRVVRSPERWPRIVDVAKGYGYDLPVVADPVALSNFLDARRAADPEHFCDLSLTIVKLLGPGEYSLVRSEADIHGHFGLAAYSYTHSTAPNRRYTDLILQRLLKANLVHQPAPYSPDELTAIARQCNLRESASRKIERLMRKVAAADLLHTHIGQIYDAIVTGAMPKGTFVRLLHPPVEGRVVAHEQGLDVGDRTRVRLVQTDVERGFIDFVAVP
ncbi:MAG: rnb [Chthonomonadaceae bacterium]|nr:rnb [Chthonomonadaceae bacterium]